MSSGDAMDPSGPSQPSLNTAYEHPSNPAQSNYEQQSSMGTKASQQRSGPKIERREPNDTISGGGNAQEEAMPSSLGYGVQDSSGDAGEKMGEAVSNQNAEQMGAAGDGAIASAQDSKHGFGEQSSLTSGLDQKKEDQARIKEQRHGGGGGGGVDVGAAVGGAGFVGADNGDRDISGGGGQSDPTHV